MKVLVDRGRCQGHGRCYATAPELFEPVNDEGHSEVVCEEIGGDNNELVEAARQALQACPERAIVIEE